MPRAWLRSKKFSRNWKAAAQRGVHLCLPRVRRARRRNRNRRLETPRPLCNRADLPRSPRVQFDASGAGCRTRQDATCRRSANRKVRAGCDRARNCAARSGKNQRGPNPRRCAERDRITIALPATDSPKRQVDSIKAAILAQEKFLGELIEHASRWDMSGGDVRLFFPTESRALAEMLQARDPIERLRNIVSSIMGQTVRVCVKLEAAAGGSAIQSSGTRELRAKFEQDPIVRAMLERFGGQISDVRRRGEE